MGLQSAIMVLTQSAGTDSQIVSQWKKFLNNVTPDLLGFVWNIVVALLIWVIGRKLVKLVLKLVNKIFDRQDTEISVRKFMDSLIRYAGYVFIFLCIYDQIGLPMTSLIAVLGSASLAVGLALQGSLSNFAGGVLILLLRPFKVGDYIIEDNKKNEGTVDAIGIFYTTLLTIDNKKVLIPNGTLANSSLTNVTSQEKRRIDLKVGISYESDLKKAKEIMLKLLEDTPETIQEKGTQVFIAALEDSAVMVEGRIWVSAEDYWPVRWRLTENIKLAYDDAGIGIAYNQLDVHLRS